MNAGPSSPARLYNTVAERHAKHAARRSYTHKRRCTHKRTKHETTRDVGDTRHTSRGGLYLKINRRARLDTKIRALCLGFACVMWGFWCVLAAEFNAATTTRAHSNNNKTKTILQCNNGGRNRARASSLVLVTLYTCKKCIRKYRACTLQLNAYLCGGWR